MIDGGRSPCATPPCTGAHVAVDAPDPFASGSAVRGGDEPGTGAPVAGEAPNLSGVGGSSAPLPGSGPVASDAANGTQPSPVAVGAKPNATGGFFVEPLRKPGASPASVVPRSAPARARATILSTILPIASTLHASIASGAT